MPEVVFSVDQSKSMRDQAVPGHNRWHPDVPPAASVQPGSEFRVECREWTDAQLGNNDSANDVRDVDLTHAHMLSGPVEIQGAEPGDLLVVDILDLGPVPQETGPAPGQGWGYTGIFAKTKVGLREPAPAATAQLGLRSKEGPARMLAISNSEVHAHRSRGSEAAFGRLSAQARSPPARGICSWERED